MRRFNLNQILLIGHFIFLPMLFQNCGQEVDFGQNSNQKGMVNDLASQTGNDPLDSPAGIDSTDISDLFLLPTGGNGSDPNDDQDGASNSSDTNREVTGDDPQDDPKPAPPEEEEDKKVTGKDPKDDPKPVPPEEDEDEDKKEVTGHDPKDDPKPAPPKEEEDEDKKEVTGNDPQDDPQPAPPEEEAPEDYYFYTCVLDGPGTSKHVGIINEALAQDKDTPDTACMSKMACEELMSTVFDVKFAKKNNGYCKNGKAHTYSLSDAQAAALVGAL